MNLKTHKFARLRLTIGERTHGLMQQKRLSRFLIVAVLGAAPIFGVGQQLENVPQAFGALGSEPEVIFLVNELNVPNEGGHLQGVQVYEKNGIEKILMSGSSRTDSYILQADLATRKTDTVISLMREPFRHAGGLQLSEPYMAVGIEDNFAKTVSKVCLYDYRDTNLRMAQPNVIIERKGEAKKYTAGATGIVALETYYLTVVSNWDSRHWDFYHLDPKKNQHQLLIRFTAPDDWASYQSINLIHDEEAIYAIGCYTTNLINKADLIRVSTLGTFEPIMKKVGTKTFRATNDVDFNSATGLQVDKEGKLHIWGTQRNALKQMVINKFSQQ